MTLIEVATEMAPLVGSSIPGLVAGIAGWTRAKSSDAKAREAVAEAARVEAESDARVKKALADALESMRGDLSAAQAMAQEALNGLRDCVGRERDAMARELAMQKEFAELRLMIGISR